MINLVIFDDNNNYRESLKHVFSFIDDIDIVSANTDCNNVREVIQEHLPDVVLMDIDMPGMNGIDATLIVKELSPKSQVIMLTVSEEEQRIFDALRNGATGYLLKKSSSTELIEAVRTVFNGGSPMTPAIARKVLQFFNTKLPNSETKNNKSTIKATAPKNTENDAFNNLTPRELEILEGLVDGLSYKMIGGKLFISPDTVKNHLQGVYRKLQVNSKGEAISFVLKNNLVK
jgi:DNA-binding NarL/FixJ family response regulator